MQCTWTSGLNGTVQRNRTQGGRTKKQTNWPFFVFFKALLKMQSLYSYQTFNHNNQSDIHLINLRDDQYPLFLAIGDGDIKAVRILIENDADHSYTSANGSTLLMHAINLGKEMCLTF